MVISYLSAVISRITRHYKNNRLTLHAHSITKHQNEKFYVTLSHMYHGVATPTPHHQRTLVPISRFLSCHPQSRNDEDDTQGISWHLHLCQDEALQLCGERTEGKVFRGLTRSMVNYPLRKWITTAGIKKHISFHLARHRGFYIRQITNRLTCLLMKVGNDKETSELLYSTLFCHFKEPLYLLQR